MGELLETILNSSAHPESAAEIHSSAVEVHGFSRGSAVEVHGRSRMCGSFVDA